MFTFFTQLDGAGSLWSFHVWSSVSYMYRGTHVIPTVRMVHGGFGKTAVYICVPLSVADEVQSDESE